MLLLRDRLLQMKGPAVPAAAAGTFPEASLGNWRTPQVRASAGPAPQGGILEALLRVSSTSLSLFCIAQGMYVAEMRKQCCLGIGQMERNLTLLDLAIVLPNLLPPCPGIPPRALHRTFFKNYSEIAPDLKYSGLMCCFLMAGLVLWNYSLRRNALLGCPRLEIFRGGVSLKTEASGDGCLLHQHLLCFLFLTSFSCFAIMLVVIFRT